MEELTPEMNYRFTIIESIDFLYQTKNELFIKLVNIAMAGEYSEANFGEGDEMPADISYFKNCKDQNVQTMIKHIQIIQNTINYLMYINKIQDDELGITVTEI